MDNKDQFGRRRDCHFCLTGTKKVICTVLKDFYNSEKDSLNLCGDCPFYKTDEDFWEGWKIKKEVS